MKLLSTKQYLLKNEKRKLLYIRRLIIHVDAMQTYDRLKYFKAYNLTFYLANINLNQSNLKNVISSFLEQVNNKNSLEARPSMEMAGGVQGVIPGRTSGIRTPSP